MKGKLFVGIDWAFGEHQVCVLDDHGRVLGERVYEHSGESLTKLCDWLVELSGGRLENVCVAIEVPRGPVVETLLERGAAVFAINPKQLDRFRDRFTVAGAKDDRRDARVLGDSLRTDMRCFRKLDIDAPEFISLREWSRMHDDIQQDRVRMSNRLRQQLRRYYPQMLELAQDVDAEWFLALWKRVPTPAHAARVRKASIGKLLKQHRIRRFDAAHVLDVLRQKPLSVAPGTVQAASDHIHILVAQLRLANKQLKHAQGKLDKVLAELGKAEKTEEDEPGKESEPRDVEILKSLPGIGRIVLATLLAEAPQPLASRDYHALRMLTGIAPVTRASGKSLSVVMRRACNTRLRDAMYHWARVATQHDPRSKAKYAALRARGHSHGRALRQVGDRLLKVACAMLEHRTLFDENLSQPRVAA